MRFVLVCSAYMILFFSIYKLTFWLKGRKKKNDLNKLMEVHFLQHYFKVDVKRIGLNKLLNIIALSNAFIFTVVLISTSLITNYIIRLLVMFVILMPLIYVVYYGISKYLEKERK
ncbi:MAG: hypothetical protein PHI22_04480 [Bacilli bacterium]|nr:hypothetical protein [Bacilli bacterium]MDD4298918.1 hypothetical protein [Bacilli bacterium]